MLSSRRKSTQPNACIAGVFLVGLALACGVAPSDTPAVDSQTLLDVEIEETTPEPLPDTEITLPQDTTPPPPCGGPCPDDLHCVDERCVPLFCPPEAPHGVDPGQTLTNAMLKDCDGNDYSLHQLCGEDVAWFTLVAGW